MKKFDINTGDCPFQKSLCVFRLTRSDKTVTFVLGYFYCNGEAHWIREYNSHQVIEAKIFDAYQEILNDNEGIYFIK